MGTLAAVLVPDLRPLSVGEIIDVAIKIWRRHLPTLAPIVVVVVAPLQILASLVMASVTPAGERAFETIDAAGNPTVDSDALAGWLAGMLTAQAIAGLGFLIASAAVLRSVSVAYLGGVPQWRESLRAVTGRLGSLLWLGFLVTAGLGLAALALVVPAIWLGVAWSIAFPVLIAEGHTGTGALRRAFGLVRGRWWPTFGTLLLAFAFEIFVGIVLGLPLGLLTEAWDSDSAATLAVSTVFGVASAVITTPFMSAVLVLIYFDLRVRKEGFDLDLLAQGVGLPGAVVPAGGPSSGAPGGWSGPGRWPAPGGAWPEPAGGGPTPAGTPPPPGGWGPSGRDWGPPGTGAVPPPPDRADRPDGWGPPPPPPVRPGDEPPAPHEPTER